MAYEKKIPFDLSCGIKIAMEVIGGKWKSCIIYDLRHGPMRPSELMKFYPEANTRVINNTLKDWWNTVSSAKRYTRSCLRTPNIR